ncbi:hypothetical protein ACP6NG_18140 [Brevibacterium casei]|uniref:hypothetical protein n=1 Tax=Brevibacterium casei TaxID=33889 RepID=UPI003F805A04
MTGDEPDLADAQEFFDYWFEPDDLVCLMLMKGKRTQHHYVNATELIKDMDEASFSEAVTKHQLYFALAPCKEELVKAGSGKPLYGGNANLKEVIGLYVDLDLKDGCFEEQGEILAFLDGLEIPPSVIVDSGSGGIHAYWKLTERLDVKEAKRLQEGWWLWSSP